MDTTFDTVFKLLGHSLKSREHDTFIQAFGPPDQEVDILPGLRKYEYQRNGLSLAYSVTEERFWSATFSFFSRAVIEKTSNPFEGEVYAGIKGIDTQKEVGTKIGLEPYYKTAPNSHRVGDPSNIVRPDTNSVWETYEVEMAGMPMCTLDLIFEAFTGRLKILSMSFPDWHS